MKTQIAILLLSSAAAFSSIVQATPLEQLRDAPVSKLEFGNQRGQARIYLLTEENNSILAPFIPERISSRLAMYSQLKATHPSSHLSNPGAMARFLYSN